MGVIQRRDSAPAPIAGAGERSADGLGPRFAGLVEFLSCTAYPDGAPRKAGTLTLFVEEGYFKACLNDRDQSLTAWAADSSLEALLDGLERGLQSDTLTWRGPPKTGRKKR